MSTAIDAKRREIMRNVKQTCTELAAKFEQIHRQVIKPVEEAKDAVASTMGTVTDTVSSARHVVETVGEHVAKQPWLAMFGSIAAGLGTGLLMGGRSTSTTESTTTPAAFNGYSASIPAPPTKPSFLSRQINKITGVAVGAGLAVVRDLVKDKMPDWADAADSIASDLTEQFGAVPFTGTILQPSEPFPASVN
jgi:ElaB/YqjD/DUF883 family membrane-anchored ribosome-binding protein